MKKSKQSETEAKERADHVKKLREAGFQVNDDGDLVGYHDNIDDLVKRAKGGSVIAADIDAIEEWIATAKRTK